MLWDVKVGAIDIFVGRGGGVEVYYVRMLLLGVGESWL